MQTKRIMKRRQKQAFNLVERLKTVMYYDKYLLLLELDEASFLELKKGSIERQKIINDQGYILKLAKQ